MALEYLKKSDPEVADILAAELTRERNTIELIASENVVSRGVMEAVGSVLTNKYAEGYSGRRYYGGCEKVDLVETLAIERAKALFNCQFANVQPHSGSQANYAAYAAVVKPGDTVLLSPACASWDMYDCFEQRGEHFKKCAKELGAK